MTKPANYPIVPRLNKVTGRTELYMVDDGQLTCFDGEHSAASWQYYHQKTMALPPELGQVVFDAYCKDWGNNYGVPPVMRQRLTR